MCLSCRHASLTCCTAELKVSVLLPGTDNDGTAASEQQLLSDYQEGQFQRYMWREGQGHPFQQGAPARTSPSEASSSLSGEDEDEALPTSLSGMARHFQAQRSARGTRRRRSGANTDARYCFDLVLFVCCFSWCLVCALETLGAIVLPCMVYNHIHIK